MKNTYIKPEMTTVQIDCGCNMLAASGETLTAIVAPEDDYATEVSYSKGNRVGRRSLWDDYDDEPRYGRGYSYTGNPLWDD